jgi:hypothetical protein
MSTLFTDRTGRKAARRFAEDRTLVTIVGGWLSGRAATGTDRGLGRATGARC